MQFTNAKYAMPLIVHEDPYHVPILRQRMTHSIGLFFADMLDEMRAGFEKFVPEPDNDSGTSRLLMWTQSMV